MKILLFIFFLIFCYTFSLFGDNTIQHPDINEIQLGIKLSIQEKYDAALEIFNNMIIKHPKHPSGYFFLAAIWQSRMMDFETSRWNRKFYDYINQTIILSKEQIAEKPESKYAHFYLGAAYSYKSFQLARDKKYLSAIRMALKSMNELNKTIQLDSSFCDPYLGIGSYQYWRSNITKKFSWLPFFSDQRKEGIERIHFVIGCGEFTGWAALSNLAWIYIEEKNYSLAIDVTNRGLVHFPNSRFYLWPLGDAQFKNNDYKSAIRTYTKLLQSVTAEKLNNHYNEIVLHLKLAKCHYQLKDYDEAFYACKRVLEIEPDEEVKKRIKKKKQQALKILVKLNNTLDD